MGEPVRPVTSEAENLWERIPRCGYSVGEVPRILTGKEMRGAGQANTEQGGSGADDLG